jgi:hypothetical protein
MNSTSTKKTKDLQCIQCTKERLQKVKARTKLVFTLTSINFPQKFADRKNIMHCLKI